MADLATLDEVKGLLGIATTDTRSDAQFTNMIPVASDAIRAYTQRDFGTSAVSETRTFEYDGSGYVEIDDATAITLVEFVVPNTANISIPSDQWTAKPYGGPIFNYLQIFADYTGVNPWMGFARNLDVLYDEGRLRTATAVVAVTGTWGWPTVPGDVKLALAWTLQDWKSKGSSDNLTSEAIEGYSRSWAGRAATNAIPALAIPNKARDLLANYLRFDV